MLSKYDYLDREIIEYLNKDARLSSAEISRKLGVSKRTVHYRIKRLTELGVLRFIAVVNPLSFGYTLAVDIFCELDVGYEHQALEEILKLPEICYVAISTGDQDISLQAIFKSGEDLQDFITHKLHQVPGIRRTKTVLIPRIIKDTYQWVPTETMYNSIHRQQDSHPD
jgi:Lrp/AsnC family transcriptional regulator for asnA, asnC and gidA